MTKRKISVKFVSVLLLIAMLVTYIPVMMTASAAERNITNRVTDTSTMDAWKDFFLADILSTKNSGAIWTDKSVFLDSQAFAGTGITMKDKDAFLVALSLMGSNSVITGMSHLPTDTMLVLDVSGSMNDNNNGVAEELVQAANASIHALLSGNKYNRVGVVLYSGSSYSDTNNDAAVLMLPLNRYKTASDGKYLTYTETWGGDENIGIDSDVVIENTTTRPTSTAETVAGATYIQKGIILAKDQFVASSNATTVTDPVIGTVNRMPVMVLMSDGAPSLGSTNFTSPGQYNLGNGSDTSAALGFVTQLTAAYAKELIEDKYGSDCYFYTLGLGVNNNSTAVSVLDPDNKNASTAVNDLWVQYNSASVNGTVTVQGSGYNARRVTKISTSLDQNYVNQYFEVTSSSNLAQGLIDAFKDIVNAIQLKSRYYPTLTESNPDISGNVSFVDKIGNYMTVTDIKGILIHNTLFSGADLAKNFAASANGGALGTPQNPTALGNEMVWAVQQRLGIENIDDARTLIDLAYQNGQLSYTSDTEFSNYIGWYANAAGQFLGFWHEGITTMPDPSDPTLTDATRPAFIVKSYGYLGEVDEEQGVDKSDMMYATVQVRENIVTGEEIVTFSLPAALIPIITYNITLDEDGALTKLEATGADYPARLVYEVALKDEINEINITEKVSADYIAKNTNADGSVNFYTNQYEVDNSTGYGKVNTYSYFNPSKQNERYYYTENSSVYTNTNGTLYTGDTAPSANGTYYRAYKVYEKDGSTLTTRTLYREISSYVLATAKKADDNSWYIPAGDIHVNLSGMTVYKGGTSTEIPANNKTGTLKYTKEPFVDHTYHAVDETGYSFYVGSTLGNNGKISITPATILKITKALAADATATAEKFEFTVTHIGSAENASYEALLVGADGSKTDATVQFTSGKAKVELASGEAIYITGLTAGDIYKVEEKETEKYIVSSVNNDTSAKSVNVTAVANRINEANFVNEDRGSGDLTISKLITHDLGTDHTLPADMTFTMKVTLSGIGTANKTFTAEHTNSSVSSVTTNENGEFTVTLKHGERFAVFGLPAGTVAKVVEQTQLAGFTPTYMEDGIAGDGSVTIAKGVISTVIVVNDYEAKEVYPVDVIVTGTKFLSGRDWKDTDSFTFELQKYIDGEWQTIATDTATKAKQTLSFVNAFANAKYTQTGVYYYRVTEIEPASDAIGGVSYDKTVHAFGVIVTDKDMDGQLEISEVRSYRQGSTHVTAPTDENRNWLVDIDFTNEYSATGVATVTIDLNKAVTNESGSPLGHLAGFKFALYNADGSIAYESEATTDRGFARLVLRYTEAGTYKYTLKEVIPANTPLGWTYSTETVPVTVIVSDNGVGGFDAVIFTGEAQGENATNSISTTFTNVYDPTDAELSLDVNKRLTGRDMAANEFTFEVRDADGKVVLTGKNTEALSGVASKVAFDGTLKFDKVGTFAYTVVETSAGGKGVSTDKNTYIVVVTVTDNNGQLTASYDIENVVGNNITFENVYSTAPTTHTVSGTKTLVGKALLNDEFTFIMSEASDANGTVPAGAKTWETKNFINGTFAFDAITYTKAGTYYYVVMEKAVGGTTGIRFDDTKYVVAVTVSDRGDGTFSVSQSVDNSAAKKISFVNTYTANPTTTELPGNKTLTGKLLGGGDFEFELYRSNASWQEIEVLQSVKNGADGSIKFDTLKFEKAGTYYYVVKEADAGKVIDGVTYDDTHYHVRIVVTDDLRGQLHAEVHIYDQNGIPKNAIEFVNAYEIDENSEARVVLSGTKTLTGKDLFDGMFAFELYTTGADFALSGTPKTATNIDGKYAFALDYTASDAGKTFYYVVREANAGKTIHGITYSDTVYQITVKVEDDGVGGIKTTVSVNNNVTATTLDFTNTYEVSSDAYEMVVLGGHKTLTGKELVDGTFRFELYSADASFTAGELLKATRNVNGRYAFALEYTDADIGKTLYYVVKEENAGKTINGITYSSTEYQVTVKVEDNGTGGIKTTVTVNNATATTLDFTNTYKISEDAATSVELRGHKYLMGQALADGMFTFELYTTDADFAVSGTPKTATNVGDKFSFTQSYTAADAGKTFYYVVREANAGKTIDGITYSDVVYKITVKVEDDGQGGVKATATVNNNTTVTALDFTNVYALDTDASASVTLSGNKTLTGKELADGMFTFELYTTGADFAVSGTPKTATNVGGKFSFTQSYTAADAGKTFYYVVREANAGKTIDGITYSDVVYKITVKVEDDGQGGVKATATVNNNTTVTALDFTNVYALDTDASASVTLSGNKTLTGKELADGMFTFELYTTDADFAVSGTPKTATNVGGKFSFTQSYTAADAGKTFYYVVREANAGKTIDGITYSDVVYKITVKVEDDGVGSVKVTATVDGGAALNALDFVNEYKVSDDAKVDKTISGKKVLTGRDLVEGEFAFLLYSANSDFTVGSGTTPVRVVNGADGSFAFEDLTFTKAGTYYFVIVEDLTVKAENVTFDTSEYRVTIEVSDDGKGGLTASDPIITKGEEKAEALEFTNVYTLPEIPDNPKTGDNTLWMWLVMILISASTAIGVTLHTQKRRRVED